MFRLDLVFLLSYISPGMEMEVSSFFTHVIFKLTNICLAEFSYFDDFLTVNCLARFQESFTLYSKLITVDSSHLLISTTICQHLCIIQLCSDSFQHVWQFFLFSRLKIGSLLKVGLASLMQILTHFLVKQ